MNTRELQLEDKQYIDELRIKYGHYTSSHAFDTIYIWRKEMGLTIFIEDELFAVKYNSKGSNVWFFPCGSKESVYRFIEKNAVKTDIENFVGDAAQFDDITMLCVEYIGRA